MIRQALGVLGVINLVIGLAACVIGLVDLDVRVLTVGMFCIGMAFAALLAVMACEP